MLLALHIKTMEFLQAELLSRTMQKHSDSFYNAMKQLKTYTDVHKKNVPLIADNFYDAVEQNRRVLKL